MPAHLIASTGNDAPWAMVITVVAAVGGTALGLIQWRRRWTVIDTPTSECAGVFVGRNEVVGIAQPQTPLTSPISGSSAVWFEWLLEHYTQNGKSGSWHKVDGGTTAAPFWVTDSSGSVLVRPRDAEVKAKKTVEERANQLDLSFTVADLHMATLQGEDEAERMTSMAHPRYQGILSKALGLGPNESMPLMSWGHEYRITEHLIEPGSQVYVLGYTALRDGTTALEFAQKTDSEPLLIANETEKQVARGAGWLAAAGLTAGLLGVIGIPAALLAVRTSFAGGPVPGSRGTLEASKLWMIGAGVAYLLALVAIYFGRHYNRLVAVKEQAASAWSLIDVALRRRHDLIPQLVTVAKASSAHEQQVQVTLAGLRAGAAEVPKEALPSDATVAAANGMNQQDSANVRSLLALKEAYPDLHANDQFTKLAAEVTDTENQVAAARRFYNDAVNVLRDRRQTYPGALFAPFVKVPSWELFADQSTVSVADRDTSVPPGPTTVSV